MKLLGVESVVAMVDRIGLETVLSDMADYVEADFRRWASFEKSPRLASHSDFDNARRARPDGIRGPGSPDAKFINLPVSGASTVSGELPGASKFQGNAAIDYYRPIGADGLGLRANLTYTRRTGYFTTVDNLRTVTIGPANARVTIPYGRVPAFGYLDGRLALSGEDSRWEVALFGRNLTNETYVVGYDRDFFGTLVEGLGDPRTYGVELTARF